VGKINALQILVEKLEEKTSLGRLGCRWKDNNVSHKYIGKK
jgi:hypothetical protein